MKKFERHESVPEGDFWRVVLVDHWRYGESRDAGYEPYLKRGQLVFECGPRHGGHTYVFYPIRWMEGNLPTHRTEQVRLEDVQNYVGWNKSRDEEEDDG